MPNITDTVTTPDGTCTVRLFTPDGSRARGPAWSCSPTPAACATPSTRWPPSWPDSATRCCCPDVYYRNGRLGPVRHGQRVRRRKRAQPADVHDRQPDAGQNHPRRHRVLRLPGRSTRGGRGALRRVRLLHGWANLGDGGRPSSRPRRGRGVLPRWRPGGRHSGQPAPAGRPDQRHGVCGRRRERRVLHGRPRRTARQSADGGRRAAHHRVVLRRPTASRCPTTRPTTPPPTNGIGRR